MDGFFTVEKSHDLFRETAPLVISTCKRVLAVRNQKSLTDICCVSDEGARVAYTAAERL